MLPRIYTPINRKRVQHSSFHLLFSVPALSWQLRPRILPHKPDTKRFRRILRFQNINKCRINQSYQSRNLLFFLLLAEGTGNDDISLQCPGSLKVIRVGAFGISGDNKTVEDFDKHCQVNLALVDKTKVCIVSLKRVYKSSYPPFIKTLVTYTCSYTEFISKQQ